jgi:gliding motility-associatede transport system auxiliary component
VTGHGEEGIQTEYARASDGLRDNLFHVAEVDLLRSRGVPKDAAVLVLAGPRRPLAEQEIAILSDYLSRGGRLLLLVDPDPTADIRQLLAMWWLDVEDGHLIDPASHVVPNADNILVPRTRNALGLPETYFPGATALIPKPEIPASMEVSALAWSSPESWLETDAGTQGEPAFDEGEDKKGPLALGALVRAVGEGEGAEGARLAVIGDSDFATNRHFLNGGNGDLFVKVVNWLAAGQEVVAIDRKVLPIRRLLLSPEEARFLHLSSIGLLPSLLLVAAGIVWWRRWRS